MSDVRNRLVQAGDLHLNVFEWGSAAKPLLILLHGLASSSHMFDLIAPELALDYRIITFDQRGHGLSDKPTIGYDFETIASDLDRLIGSLDSQIHLLCWWGILGAHQLLYIMQLHVRNGCKKLF